jgi:hypothetical protein
MKSLEVDAMKAQAVIGLAKEMQEKSKLPTVPDAGTAGRLKRCHITYQTLCSIVPRQNITRHITDQTLCSIVPRQNITRHITDL